MGYEWDFGIKVYWAVSACVFQSHAIHYLLLHVFPPRDTTKYLFVGGVIAVIFLYHIFLYHIEN